MFIQTLYGNDFADLLIRFILLLVQLFVPCPAAQRAHHPCAELDTEQMASMERQIQAGEQSLAALRADCRACWRKQRSQWRRQPGMPPSWARKSNRHPQVLPDGVDPESVVTYRRKLIHKDTKAPRPAYYGSWSTIRCVYCK
eukprot:scaffold55582_cov47-Prasinocladus_malaysianus.AAC.2